MLSSKKLKEVETRVKQYIRDGTIKTKRSRENVDFFLSNAKNSLQTARLLLDVSGSEKLQETTGYLKFNGYLWVINAGYYSMFYTTRALLENSGVKLKSELSIHLLTFDALVYYFYLSGKLQRKLIEVFAEAKEEAAELLGKETADELITSYFFEKGKRAKLTYNTGEIAMRNKAVTSTERARKFNRELRRIILNPK